MLLTSLSRKKAISRGTIWDMGPQSIRSSNPQNPGCFLLQICAYSLGLSLLLHVHNAAIHSDMTQAYKLPLCLKLIILSFALFLTLCVY